ncbi:MAG: hypothetical protein OXC31_15640 [Spirochaetaceae bacterium]|nr:hypothetical protein [Spirochaetaceae bacterium]
MSRTLMHTEYHSTDFTVTGHAVGLLAGWLRSRADAGSERAEALRRTAEAIKAMGEDDEPVSGLSEQFTAHAATIDAELEATADDPANDDDRSLREVLSELATALRTATEGRDVVHLSFI